MNQDQVPFRSSGPRPTIDEVKAAMGWWNGLTQPAKEQVRRDMYTARGHSVGTSEIARHWLSIGCPGKDLGPTL